jgi:3-methyladenine DNA glycosylase Mpg
VSGIADIAKARELADLDLLTRDLRKLASGPESSVTLVLRVRAMAKRHASPSDLQVMSDGFRVKEVAVTQRIGITKSAELPLRYVIAGNAFVSKK